MFAGNPCFNRAQPNSLKINPYRDAVIASSTCRTTLDRGWQCSARAGIDISPIDRPLPQPAGVLNTARRTGDAGGLPEDGVYQQPLERGRP